MREWLPADNPVWLVVDTVAQLDTSACHQVVPPVRAVRVHPTGTGLGGTYGGYPEPEAEVLEGVALKLAAAAWYLSATPAQVEAVTGSRPQIPPEVDRVLRCDATDAHDDHQPDRGRP